MANDDPLAAAQRRNRELEAALTRAQQQLVDYHKRIAFLIDDIDALLSKKPTNGQLAHQLLDFFCKRWEKKHGAKYAVDGGREMAQLKRLLTTFEPRDLAERIVRYLNNDDDRFVVDKRHPIGLFVKDVNKYGGARSPASVNAPVDCRHEPPCKTDVEHTKRRNAEVRERSRGQAQPQQTTH